MKHVPTPLRVDQRRYYIIPSPDGKNRLCMAVLMAWIKEQLLISRAKTFSCPVCCAGYADLPWPECFGVCTGDSIILVLRDVRAEFPSASVYEFKLEIRKLELGLSGTFEDPCWEGLGIDPYAFRKQDILHGIHKFVWDHPGTWLRNLLGDQEMDH